MKVLRPTLLRVLLGYILLYMLPAASGLGFLEFKIIQFQNYRGLDADGDCCSQITGDNSKTQCSLNCRPTFRICLKPPEEHEQKSCTLGANLTVGNDQDSFRVYNFQDRVMATSGVMRSEVSFRWRGSINIVVEVWHRRLLASGRQGADDDENGRQLLLRVVEEKQLPAGEGWLSEDYSNAHSRLRVQMRFVCAEDFHGAHCNYCTPHNDSTGKYVCDKEGNKICLPGWQGPKCKDPVCLLGCEHGSCEKPGECLCKVGYTGTLCDTCIPYPGCVNGICKQPFECNCRPGWGGVFCNQDMSYCENHKPCQNGGTCSSKPAGRYKCTCPAGYSGTNCELKVETCDANPCQNGGTCHESGANYTCSCTQGFSGRHCQSNARSCVDKPCENGAVCVNTKEAAGYSCLCQPGWEGTNCDTETDLCRSDPCMNGGSCVTEFGKFKCICLVGFAGDRCEQNINDCRENVCLNGGTCEDEVNNFRCHCKPGYMGSLCQTKIKSCLKHMCHNNGTCIELVNDFACVCPPGFKGKDCSVRISHCDSNPCRNGGSCQSTYQDYVCQCPQCFSGRNCHERSQNCPLGTKQQYVNYAPATFARGEDDSRRFVDELRSSFSEIPVLIAAPLASVLVLIMLILILVIYGLYRRSKYHRNKPPASPGFKNNSTVCLQQKNKLSLKRNNLDDWKLAKGQCHESIA